MKRVWLKCVMGVALLVIMGSMSFSAHAASKVLSNPRQVATNFGYEKQTQWDLVQFGTYNYKPIMWRVLKVNGNDVFLMSEGVMFKSSFYSKSGPTSWEKSGIRSYLNAGMGFLTSFNSTELKYIKKTKVYNSYKTQSGYAAQNSTIDQLYLPSVAEVTNTSFGFKRALDEDVGRCTPAFNNPQESAAWLLRTVGKGQNTTCVVSTQSCGDILFGDMEEEEPNTGYVYAKTYDIRPVLHLNIQKTGICKYVGTVVAKGRKTIVKPVNVISSVALAPKKTAITYCRNNKKKTVTVKWKKISGVKGYQVVYAKNKAFTKAKKTKTVTSRSLALKKLRKGTYYFKVRCYRLYNKKKIYSGYTTVRTVRVKK